MRIHERSVSRARVLLAPRLECLEDRRLLSVLSPDNGVEGPDGSQGNQTILVSVSSSEDSAISASTVVSSGNTSQSDATVIALATNSGTEDQANTTDSGLSPSSSSGGANE